MLWDLMFDALFHSAPRWAQIAIMALLVILLASLFGWLWSSGNLK